MLYDIATCYIVVKGNLMKQNRPIDRKIRRFFSTEPLAACAEEYRRIRNTLPSAHTFVLRVIVGARHVYGERFKTDRPKTTDPAKRPDVSLVGLYQELTPEQCRTLYLQQHDNLDPRTRAALLSVIGSKVIYGDDYVPNLR